MKIVCHFFLSVGNKNKYSLIIIFNFWCVYLFKMTLPLQLSSVCRSLMPLVVGVWTALIPFPSIASTLAVSSSVRRDLCSKAQIQLSVTTLGTGHTKPPPAQVQHICRTFLNGSVAGSYKCAEYACWHDLTKATCWEKILSKNPKVFNSSKSAESKGCALPFHNSALPFCSCETF